MVKIRKILSVILSISIILSGLSMESIAFANDTTQTDDEEKALLSSCSFDSRSNKTGVPNGIKLLPDFDPNCFEYEVVVTPPLRTAAVGKGIGIDVASDCADATIVANYDSTDAKVKQGSVSVKCIDSEKTENTVELMVIPPDGSALAPSKYRFHVRLAEENRLIGVKYSTDGNRFTKLLDPASALPNEKYEYEINVEESKKKITLDLFTADKRVQVYVNGESISGGATKPKYAWEYKKECDLKYGRNVFTVQTKFKGRENVEKTYTITVNRARPLIKCEFSIPDGGIIRNSLVSEGFKNDLKGYTYAATGENKTFKVNVSSNENIIITSDIPATKENVGKYEDKIIGTEGLTLNRPTYARNGEKDYYGRLKMAPTTAKIYVTKQGEDGEEDVYDEYTLNVYARMPDGASRISAAQTAPGQFVNGGFGFIVDSTLLADINTDNLYNIHSLGTFGGSITYEFDEPIKNNPNNQYGVDFVVYGNSFGKGAAEAASVSVSSDGVNWYNLAGSEHYELSTDWNYWVKYNKGTDEGINTRLGSFSSKDGAENRLNFRSDMYWPLNALHNPIGEETLGDSYTLNGVCTYSGVGEKPSHAFGYADISPNGDVNPTAISVENPYISGAQYMDLSWAVDDAGKPVQLDEVRYVKATNCVLYFTEAFGELSPEIGGISKVNASTMKAVVGVTEEPSSIKINGIEYIDAEFSTSQNGQQKYIEVDLNDTSICALDVEVKGAEKDNIWVNNQRSVGSAQRTMILNPAAENLGNRMVRVIVQNGEKEPLIYVFKFTGGGNPASNADLEKITLVPGDVTWQEQDFNNGSVTYELENNIEKISLKASTLNPASTMILKCSDTKEIELKGDTASEPIAVNVGNNDFEITVTSADKATSETYNIKLIRKEAQMEDNTIQVNFTFTGDKIHHCDAEGNPLPGHTTQTWIPQTAVKVPKGSTVKYVTDMMLYNAGIDFATDKGTYISQVKSPTENKWLGEFTNGSNSGWMYRHNGKIADVGYAERVLSDGDAIVWFYTDDYKKETGYEGNWNDVLNPESSQPVVQDTTATVGKDGEAFSKVTASDVDKLVDEAVKQSATTIEINVKGADKADKVTVELPKDSVKEISDKTDAALQVTTPHGSVVMDRKTMNEVVKAAEGNDIQIIVEKKTPLPELQKLLGTDISYTEVTILSNGHEIKTFGTAKLKLNLNVPAKIKDKKLMAAHVDENGKLTKMPGKLVTIDNKPFYQIETTHLSHFVVAEESVIDEAIKEQAEENDTEKLIGDVKATTIKLKSKLNKRSIKLTWTKSTDTKVDGYQIYRSIKKSAGYKKYATTKKLTYTNKAKLKKGTRYYYKVRGFKVIDGKTYYTKWSNKANRKMKANSLDYGVKKTTVKAKAAASKGAVKLTWTKSKGYKVDGYQVYRSANKTKNFKKLGTTAKKTFKNTKTLKKGKTYYYKVRGYRVLDGKKVYTKWSKTISVKAE